jgi:hypothetical protein
MTRAFKVGRQPTMMPTVFSIIAQSAASGLSHVLSVEMATAYLGYGDSWVSEHILSPGTIWNESVTHRLWNRTMEMMQIAPPSPKTTISAILCLFAMFRLCNTGSGNNAVAISVTMLKLELVNLPRHQHTI